MTRPPVRTNPAIIRDALAIADEHSLYRAAKETGIHSRTIQRWRDRRTAIGRPWPTDTDIEAWETDQAANAPVRAAKAEQARVYRNRVYLNRGPLQVPALGTMRRIRALCALGWTYEEIGAEMGVTDARVGHLATGVFDKVLPATAAAVDAVYRKLCMTVPVDPEPTRRGEIRAHARSRKWARNKGWAPPLAWDDIDDPDEKPTTGRGASKKRSDVDPAVVQAILDGRTVPSTRAEKDEAMRRWVLGGRGSRASLCRRQGWKEDRYWPVRFVASAVGGTVDLHGVEDVAAAWPRHHIKDVAA